MKVLMLNGSPKKDGNTALAFSEMQKIFDAEGVTYEAVNVGQMDIRGCVACLKCRELGKCVFDDAVNEIAEKFKEADGLVLGSPVYFASANATLIALLDRLFYSAPFDKTMKVGAALAVARRSGLTVTVDELQKYFAISSMPIATARYWNNLHGAKPGEAADDQEGLQTARTLARNMVFLMKSIALGKEKYGLPDAEALVRTGFVR